MTQFSVLNRTLTRLAANAWQWSDGTSEPKVRDLSPSFYFKFRCRTDSSGGTLVEVILSVAHREPSLRWVLDGVETDKYRQDHSGDHSAPRMLTDDGLKRTRIEPDEDPLCGNEPIIHRRAIPRVALVPVAEWDAWATDNPLGASWDSLDETEILAKAKSLGWTSPKNIQ